MYDYLIILAGTDNESSGNAGKLATGPVAVLSLFLELFCEGPAPSSPTHDLKIRFKQFFLNG